MKRALLNILWSTALAGLCGTAVMADAIELRLGGDPRVDRFEVITDDYGLARKTQLADGYLPRFDYRYVLDGDRAIPERQGIFETSHPNFDWVLTAGRMDVQDGKRTMVLPVALMEKNANCIHNGTLTVALKDGAEAVAELSIAAETCAYMKFDLQVRFTANWQAEEGPWAGDIAAAYDAELASRLPVAPAEQAAVDFPGFDPAALAQATIIPPADMTAYGMVIGGRHYAGGCATRAGDYAPCGELVLPSYSLAKSLAGGLGLMRLQAIYGDAFDARVADYVPACNGDQWQGVTFGNLLDMATGNFESAIPHVDEASAAYEPFFDLTRAEKKTAFSCKHFERQAKPGAKWVYHSSDTYILGVAMNAYLTARTGRPSDYYNDLLAPFWQSLGLSPLMRDIRRTQGVDRQPFTAYGMVLKRGDIAKLGSAIAADHTGFDGFLDMAEWNAAMQRDEADRGLGAGEKTLRYNNGFWAWNAKSALGCQADTWLPFLSGYGGISVVFLPNGGLYYYFSDSGVHAFERAIIEISKITPICGENS